MTTKQCTRCGSILPLDRFYFVNRARQPDKRRGECKICVVDVRRAQRAGTWRPKCIKCREELPERRPGRQLCPSCHEAKYTPKVKRPVRNSPRIRLKPCSLCGGPKTHALERGKLCEECRPFADQAVRLRRHGLTPKDFKRIWEDQDGCCAICLEPQGEARRLAIDHDHTLEGRESVRGLLCAKCNYQRLPLFDERVDLLLSAAAYLKRGPIMDRYI